MAVSRVKVKRIFNPSRTSQVKKRRFTKAREVYL